VIGLGSGPCYALPMEEAGTSSGSEIDSLELRAVDMGEERLGRIIVAPHVLVTIARLTALATPGVSRMGGSWVGEVSRKLRHKIGDGGVEITVEDQVVTADLYIVAQHDVNLLEMGRQLQTNAARAIEEIVGLKVWAVNVHIQDVEVSETSETSTEDA
jgi:uncharacterized alkaline shock family protein YloU